MAQVAPIAPVKATMDRGALVARFGELVAEEGSPEYKTMTDGWRLKRESWRPAAPKGVILFAHGTGEVRTSRVHGQR